MKQQGLGKKRTQNAVKFLETGTKGEKQLLHHDMLQFAKTRVSAFSLVALLSCRNVPHSVPFNRGRLMENPTLQLPLILCAGGCLSRRVCAREYV